MTDDEREKWGSPIRKVLFFVAPLLLLAIAMLMLFRALS